MGNNPIEKLPEVIEAFNSLRESYEHEVERGEGSIDTYMLFRDRFCSLNAAIVPIFGAVMKLKVSRDEKACTSKKAQLIMKYDGEVDKESGRKISSSKAQQMGPADPDYIEFLEERSSYMEAYINISRIYDATTNYINSVTGRINNFRDFKKS